MNTPFYTPFFESSLLILLNLLLSTSKVLGKIVLMFLREKDLLEYAKFLKKLRESRESAKALPDPWRSGDHLRSTRDVQVHSMRSIIIILPLKDRKQVGLLNFLLVD